MSYGLLVFLVPEHALRLACGGNDLPLLEAALRAVGDELHELDVQLDAPSPDNDVDLSHADALREIITGRFTEDVPGSRFGWALSCLCAFLGEPLDDRGFNPCDGDWYDILDTIMTDRRIPLRFNDLILRDPVRIPPPDDWPSIGHWGAAELAALGPLEALLPTIDDPEVAEAIGTAVGWLRAATDHPGSLIIGFQG